MKLIDMLVEETIENGWSWPERANCITQDSDREIVSSRCHPDDAKFCSYRYGWNLKASRIESFKSRTLADDYTTSIITREQYEAALAAKNDGWIEWGGGKNPPVSTNTVVDVKLEKGYVQSGCPAGEYSCEHNLGGSNIIAYRLHQPTKSEQVRADAWNAYAGITEPDGEADLNECIGHDVATAWNGERKPTIGTKCEHHSGGQWEVVTIAGIYENLVTGFTDYWMVKEDGSSYTVGNPYRFRPIRSEADRKRDEAVGKIFDVICKSLTDESESTSFAIYDAIAAGEIPGVKLED